LIRDMASYSKGHAEGAEAGSIGSDVPAGQDAAAPSGVSTSPGRETVEIENPFPSAERETEAAPETGIAAEPAYAAYAKPAVRVVCVDNRVPAVAEIEDTLDYGEEPAIAEDIGDIFSQDFRNRSSEDANSYINNLTLGDLGVAVGSDRKSGSSESIEKVISQINNINTEALKTEKAADEAAAVEADDTGEERLKVYKPSGASDEKRKSQEFDVDSSSEQPAASVRYRVPAQYGVKNMSVDKNGKVHTLAELRNQIR
ncbi:MAG: hypothetical protein ACI4LM_01420, partial [Anaerovoracaceae bacterium]